jgi:nitric oxide reductase subunit B
VEGQSFYGFPLAEILPYAVSAHLAHPARRLVDRHRLAGDRPVHLAGAFGAGAKVPEARRQRAVRALLLIVLGSIACELVRREQRLGTNFFWLGNQGWEYVDIGRIWQLLLFAGPDDLAGPDGACACGRRCAPRATPALSGWCSSQPPCDRRLLWRSLMWGRTPIISMIEYWRWWVVHLWVEGFFEVFATAVIALIFTRSG